MTGGQALIPLRMVLQRYDEDDVIERLESYHDCVGSDQEKFLKEKAIMMEKKNMCRTYLAIDTDRRILGYYSLGLRCMKVPEGGDGGKGFEKKMNVDPGSGVAQSYLIGQLSRSEDAPKGFGAKLMKNAIRMIGDANLIVGCRLIRVDCEDGLVDYYSRHGFRPIRKNGEGDLNQMAYVLRT